MQNKLFDLYQAWRVDVRECTFPDYLIDVSPNSSDLVSWCAEQLDAIANESFACALLVYNAMGRFKSQMRPLFKIFQSPESPKSPKSPKSPESPKPQTSALCAADRLIHGQRAEEYGDAKTSFRQIAELWTAYLGTPIKSQDVAIMMALLKINRFKNSHYSHRDSLIDMLGYLALGEEL